MAHEFLEEEIRVYRILGGLLTIVRERTTSGTRHFTFSLFNRMKLGTIQW